MLWDCVATLDAATVTAIKGLGGIQAIAISHPHFYTTMVEWARAFGAHIHLNAADKAMDHAAGSGDLSVGRRHLQTVGRRHADPLRRSFRRRHACCIGPGGAGGRGVVCAGDILTVATDRKWLSFMRSYPNFIPLSAREVEHIGAAMAPFSFDVLYGHYFDRVIAKDAKPVLEKSIARYVRRDQRDARILTESKTRRALASAHAHILKRRCLK